MFCNIDIDKELDDILFAHKIITNKDVFNLLDIITRAVSLKKSIGLYGLGVEAWSLLCFLSSIKGFSISKCFDKSRKELVYKNIITDPYVLKIDEINKCNLDMVIVASKDYSEEMIENLHNLNYNGEIVDVYSLIKGYVDDHHMDYRTVSKDRILYQNKKNEDDLKKLIKDYILLKDFINAFRYIDLYISSGYRETENYIQLKKDIEDLLIRIKNNINNRTGKDIIINWVDAVSYYDMPQFNFLNNHAKESCMFNNAYTVMPWTTETLRTVLCGEYPIEGLLFNRNQLKIDNSKFLQVLNEKGYKFAYCGLPRMSRFFSEDVYTSVPLYDNKFSGSLIAQWNTLALLCKIDKPLCVIIHTIRETHEPFISGECDTVQWFGSTLKDWANPILKKQAKVASQYIDQQLDFYEKFYGNNVTEIYMSDHGRVGNSPMDENKIHTMLFVHGKDINPEIKEGMFSLVNMSLLIEKIINNNSDWDDLFNDSIIIENLDAYDSLIVDDVLSGRLNREEMCQCRGIVTKKEKYFLYADGREYFYPDRDSKKNEINNTEYLNEIERLRQKCGNEFIDIYKYDKFKYSRLLYEN